MMLGDMELSQVPGNRQQALIDLMQQAPGQVEVPEGPGAGENDNQCDGVPEGKA